MAKYEINELFTQKMGKDYRTLGYLKSAIWELSHLIKDNDSSKITAEETVRLFRKIVNNANQKIKEFSNE